MSTTIVADLSHNSFSDTVKTASLIDSAKRAGADAVLLSCYKSERIAAVGTKAYQDAREHEISYEKLTTLLAHCRDRNIAVIAAPQDIDSIAFLQNQNAAIWFVTADNLNNVPLLILMAQTGRPVFVDCASHENVIVRQCVQILKKFGSTNIVLLHSSLNRPVSIEQANFRAMVALRGNFQTEVGFIDTTEHYVLSTAAAAYGAAVVVKSLSDKTEKDSLSPQDFGKMVTDLRLVMSGLGNGDRTPSDAQILMNGLTKKHIVAAVPIKAGEQFTEMNMAVKHAPDGQDPMYWYDLCEQTAEHDYEVNDPIFYVDKENQQ